MTVSGGASPTISTSGTLTTASAAGERILNSMSVEPAGIGVGEVKVGGMSVAVSAAEGVTVGKVETVGRGAGESGVGVAPPQAAKSQTKPSSNRQNRILISNIA